MPGFISGLAKRDIMKHIIVQVYEVQTPSEAEMMIQLGVDHIGSVILSEASWKDSQIRDTVRVVGETEARSSLIPLFSNSDAILRTLDYYQPDIVHFCEAMTNQDSLFETCGALVEIQKGVKARFPEIGIMRSVPIPRPGDAASFSSLEVARIFEPVSDYFLTDTLLTATSGALPDDQPVSGFVGITGQTCDWDMAAQLVRSSRIPVVLAGGISPGNVTDGIRQTRPAGVDSCTGTNALDENGGAVRFRKDPDKVRHLLEAVRNLESEN